MKRILPCLLCALVVLSILTPRFSACFAQGGLTPPGAPAPTMKTLDQIEPRTPISSLPVTITNPGSYYLTATLTGSSGTNGITVRTNHVSIDLNGFALIGVDGSVDGINVGEAFAQCTNITVRNGTVHGWGRYGIYANSASNGRFEHLQISSNALSGLITGAGAVVSHCVASDNAGYGFDGSGNGGIFESCSALGNTDNGFHVGRSRVVNCVARANGGDGIRAYNGSLVSGCLAADNVRSGIALGADSVALNNNCLNNNNSGNGSYAGILQFFGPGRIEGNQITYSAGVGIRVSAGQTKVVVIKNTTAGNTTNSFSIPAGNDVGPWGQAATATSPWANIQN